MKICPMTEAERYITPELKELEDMILGAEDKLFALEYDLFCQVREKLAAQIPRIQLCQPGFSLGFGIPIGIYLFIIAFPDDPAFFDCQWWIFRNGGF